LKPGPHIEVLCREYALHADAAAGEVGSGSYPIPPTARGSRSTSPFWRPRIADWDRVMGAEHVARLRRARDLLAARGFDTRDTVLTCYSGAGFTRELGAGPGSDVRLVTLDDLYA
jgi:hypothetical protein